MYQVGDRVSYRRNCDGTLVSGVVKALHVRSDVRNTRLFRNNQLVDETIAYGLDLNPEDEVRVGHYVTIGSSRVITQETVT